MAIDLEKLQDSPHLLDILLQMEDVLDSLDVYVFKNWVKGQVVDGPTIRRYWLSFTLKYKYNEMPDPRAGLRLLKHGIRVDYEKAKEEADEPCMDVAPKNPDKDVEELEERNEAEKNAEDVWLVHISMPRRLVSQIATSEMDFYDEEVDEDDVEDAKDSGLDDESAYDEGDQQQQDGPDQTGDEGNAMPGDEDQKEVPRNGR